MSDVAVPDNDSDNSWKIAEKVGEVIRKVKNIDQLPGLQDFFANGFLDSFDIIHAVDELEKTFQVKIKGEDIIEENFKSVEAIAKLMAKLRPE